MEYGYVVRSCHSGHIASDSEHSVRHSLGRDRGLQYISIAALGRHKGPASQTWAPFELRKTSDRLAPQTLQERTYPVGHARCQPSNQQHLHSALDRTLMRDQNFRRSQPKQRQPREGYGDWEGRLRQQYQHLAGDAVSMSQRGALLKSTYGLVNGLSIGVECSLARAGIPRYGGGAGDRGGAAGTARAAARARRPSWAMLRPCAF